MGQTMRIWRPGATVAQLIEKDRDPGKQLEPSDASGPTLSPEARETIGLCLRRAFGDLLNRPLPDRFARLLCDLAGSERTR